MRYFLLLMVLSIPLAYLDVTYPAISEWTPGIWGGLAYCFGRWDEERCND